MGGSWQISFAESETEFFVRRDGTNYPIAIQDIGYGDFVEVSYTLEPNEVVSDICSAPISADSVTVLEATPTEDPKEEPTDNPASEPVENSTGNSKEDSSVPVLPDTGSVPLALVGGLLLSATGALLLRRIFA